MKIGILEIKDNKTEYIQLVAKYNTEGVIEDIKKVAFPGYREVLKLFYGIDAFI